MDTSSYYKSLPPLPRSSLDIPRPLQMSPQRYRRLRPLTVHEPYGASRPSFESPPSPTSSTSSRSSTSVAPSLASASTASTLRSLRHTASPRRDSLRQLRIKESEACLQQVYERQTLAYLDGSMFLNPNSPLESDPCPSSDGNPEPVQSNVVETAVPVSLDQTNTTQALSSQSSIRPEKVRRPSKLGSRISGSWRRVSGIFSLKKFL